MKDRSIFFPLVLIAAGALWILIGMGRIPAENLWALANFWPFLLIAAGIGLLLRSFWAPARAIVDLLVVGAAVLAIVFAPQLGWNTPQWGLGFANSVGGGLAGSGKIITQTREVQDFLSISIAVPAEVLIQQGQAEAVKIEADDNLLPQLTSDVENGTLIIRNKVTVWNERVNPSKTLRITITVKDLHKLQFSSAGTVRILKLNTTDLSVSLSGSGNLNLDQLTATSLEISLSGAGSVDASGQVDDLKLTISGVGSFDGPNLLSINADASISGAGSATLRASETLGARISGTGSIDYYGNPSVDKRVSGLGSVDKVGE